MPDTFQKEKIKLGVSTCLLGEKVRYDGGHKLSRYVRDTLGQYFDFVPVCPEMECGLPVPREALRLVGDPGAPRLVTNKTGIDFTEQMQNWGQKKLAELEGEDLCGYIFKSRSPSSGLERIKVYREIDGMPVNEGVGIWAGMFMDHFPYIPVEDEGRLNDPLLREHFIERVFVYARWRELVRRGLQAGEFVDFHSRHKLLLMAHSPKLYSEMGRFVADFKNMSREKAAAEYQSLLDRAMREKTTVKKHINVLHHLLGYFKKDLSADEKQEFLDLLDAFRRGDVPLIVPITLMNHFVRKYREPYLGQQYYLNPHPGELRLRNHA
ncbi:MAG: DUF523 and DUF1722 domain-containing protein [Desulfohalobiaceae bacterium]|nr:DUF523 and DUF1722 domain-containing protein [Desulfohalobiaceae bacterium]